MKKATVLLLIMIPFFGNAQFTKGSGEFSTTLNFGKNNWEYESTIFDINTNQNVLVKQKESVFSVFSQNRIGLFVSESVSLGIRFAYGLNWIKRNDSPESVSLSHTYQAGIYGRKYFELGRFFPFVEVDGYYGRSILILENRRRVNEITSEFFDSSASLGTLFKLSERTSLEARLNPFINFNTIENGDSNRNSKNTSLNMRFDISNISLGARFTL